MEKCKVTIKKDFELSGHKCFKGNWMEIYVGGNISTEKFNEFLERGFIELGMNEEFIKQMGSQNAQNRRDHESD